MPTQVTAATSELDRDAVFRFRYDLYCREQRVLLDFADHEREILSDDDDRAATLLAARDGEQMLGTLRVNWAADGGFSDDLTEALALDRVLELCEADRLAVLSRFLIAPEHRGDEVSLLLILAAAELVLERGIEVVVCDCEPHLLGYYRQLGFRPYGRLFSHATSLLIPLVLFIGDRTHLESAGSPVLGLFPEDHCPPPDRQQLGLLADASARMYRPEDDRESVQQLIERAGDAPGLLEGLGHDEFDQLTGGSFVLSFAAGDLLIGEGTTTRTLYGILDGVVEITSGDQLLAVATEGDVIGEMAMLLDRDRTATARARTDGKALALSDRAMTRLLREEPELAANVLWNLSRVLAYKLGNVDRTTI